MSTASSASSRSVSCFCGGRGGPKRRCKAASGSRQRVLRGGGGTVAGVVGELRSARLRANLEGVHLGAQLHAAVVQAAKLVDLLLVFPADLRARQGCGQGAAHGAAEIETASRPREAPATVRPPRGLTGMSTSTSDGRRGTGLYMASCSEVLPRSPRRPCLRRPATRPCGRAARGAPVRHLPGTARRAMQRRALARFGRSATGAQACRHAARAVATARPSRVASRALSSAAAAEASAAPAPSGRRFRGYVESVEPGGKIFVRGEAASGRSSRACPWKSPAALAALASRARTCPRLAQHARRDQQTFRCV